MAPAWAYDLSALGAIQDRPSYIPRGQQGPLRPKLGGCIPPHSWPRQFRDAVAPGSYLALSQMTDEAHPEAAKKLFRMTQHWNTPLISRSRADIARFFDGFTLVEPGLVEPAQWRPELDNPFRGRRGAQRDFGPVLKPIATGPAEDARGVAWHLCGIGIKDQR